MSANEYTVERFASFADGDMGGNPAGVVIAETLPPDDEMLRIAANVGYSETAFAARDSGQWRVRYFAPKQEVAFCGHATIALGAALAKAHGPGVFDLQLNDGVISVEGEIDGDRIAAALTSPPTKSKKAQTALVAEALKVFGYDARDLSAALAPAIINAGNDHLLLALSNRDRLAALKYDLESGAAFMRANGLTTVSFVLAETPRFFHSRNAFAVGGVLEDPATGAAAAALGGYLRDVEWPAIGEAGGAIDILQGEDMGAPSRLHVEISPTRGTGIRVSGRVRPL